MFYNERLKISIELTRFVDPDVIRQMGIREDLEDVFVELGMGNMATNPHVLYPQAVRQFHGHSASLLWQREGEEGEQGHLDLLYPPHPLQSPSVPGFVGRSQFWEHLASGIFESGSATQMDIHHPTL